MRVFAVQDSSLFLMAAEGKYGLTRWTAGNFDTHSRLDIFQPGDDAIVLSLAAVAWSTYAVASFEGSKKLIVYNFAVNIHLFDLLLPRDAIDSAPFSWNPNERPIAAIDSKDLFTIDIADRLTRTRLTLASSTNSLVSVKVPSSSMLVFVLLSD